jgi:serine/threonine protein kinase
MYTFTEKPTHNLSDFEFVKTETGEERSLGAGTFGSVKLVREIATGKFYAFKIFDLSDPKKAVARNIDIEISIHKRLNDHPNVIKYIGYIHQHPFVCIILEYAENGNLFKYIHKNRFLPESVIFKFFYQTCSAIDYFHKNNYMHRDIKPENLLLDSQLNIKLCDYGWAAQNIYKKRVTCCGTFEYMAPEVVYGLEHDYRIDIWALGVLLYELLHGRAPFKGRTKAEIERSLSVYPFEMSDIVSFQAKDLLLRILRRNPAERMSMEEIFEHPWMKSHLEGSSESSGQARLSKEDSAGLKSPGLGDSSKLQNQIYKHSLHASASSTNLQGTSHQIESVKENGAKLIRGYAVSPQPLSNRLNTHKVVVDGSSMYERSRIITVSKSKENPDLYQADLTKKSNITAQYPTNSLYSQSPASGLRGLSKDAYNTPKKEAVLDFSPVLSEEKGLGQSRLKINTLYPNLKLGYAASGNKVTSPTYNQNYSSPRYNFTKEGNYASSNNTYFKTLRDVYKNNNRYPSSEAFFSEDVVSPKLQSSTIKTEVIYRN